MKEVKHYICEICRTEYSDKKKAESCEKGHIRPITITKTHYVSISQDKTGYPTRITIKMEDGSEHTYKR